MKISVRYYYASQYEVQRLRDLFLQARIDYIYGGIWHFLYGFLTSIIEIKVTR